MATQPNPTKKPKKLPIKRRKFVEALTTVAAGNMTEAARIAGYSAPGSEGHRLLKYADIQKAVEERLSRGTVKADEIQSRLALMAAGTIPTKTVVETGTAMDSKGEPIPVSKKRHEFSMESATNTLAKIAGLLKDKEPTPPAQVNVAVINQLPDGARVEVFKAFLSIPNE